jgi:hypothetical protein
MFEDGGEIELDRIFVGDDELELDRLAIEQFSTDPPECIERLART